MPNLKQRNDNSTRRALIGTDRKYCVSVLHIGHSGCSSARLYRHAHKSGFSDAHTLYCTHVCAHTHTHPIAPSVTLSAWLILSHNPLRQTVCTDVTYNKEWISSTFSSLLSTLLLDSLWAQSVVHRKPEEQYTNHNKHAASLDFCSAQHGHVDTDWFSI